MTPTSDQQTTQSQTDKVNSQNQIIQTEAATVQQQTAQSQATVEQQAAQSQTMLQQQAAQSQTDKVSSEHQNSQTDAMSVDQQAAQSQTDQVEKQNTTIQTTIIDTQHSSMQTAPKEEEQKSQQTDDKVLATVQSQTDVKQLETSHSQTELLVRVVPESADQNNQAGSWNPSDSQSQTDQSMSLMIEGGCQAAVDIAIGESQTVSMVTEEQDTQTFIDTEETGAQAVVEEHEMACQAVVDDYHNEAQTDISLFNMVEGSAQAVVEVDCQECQATVDCHIQEIQTDSSMALLVEQDIQASVEASEQIVQTDAAQLTEQIVQTELETDQKFCQTDNEVMDNDCQTSVDVAEMETQTDVEEPPQIIVTSQEQDMSVPEVAATEESQTFMASQTSSVSVDGMPELSGMGPVQTIEPREFCEEGCQTDPVTIIIGDASFLVKKLKGAALSPTKVSSMGNEIEIELRADEEEEHQYDQAERENAKPQQQQQPVVRGSPGGRGARGVRTRGGAMRGSPRVGQVHGNYQQPRQVAAGPYYASSAGGQGKYSCPVCSDTFHESPALYEHLQHVHREAFSLIKKPRGREGKTIVMKAHREPDPPVLTPMEPMIEQQQQQQQLLQQQQYQRQLQQQQLQQQQLQQQLQQQELQQEQQLEHELRQQQLEQQLVHQEAEIPEQIEVVQASQVIEDVVQEVHEIGLFEDPGAWSPNKSRKRTLARRQINDDEVEQPQDQEYQIVIQPTDAVVEETAEPDDEVVMGKRKRGDMEEMFVKRIRSDEEHTEEEELELEQQENEETENIEEQPSRRRSGRAIKLEKDDPQTPRTRGRLRTPKK